MPLFIYFFKLKMKEFSKAYIFHLTFKIGHVALSPPQLPAQLFNLPLPISVPLRYHDLSPHCWMKWLEWIRSEHGSIVMARLLAGQHKKRPRFRGWSVRRHSPLMKCILHYLSAVLWHLSADKIDTDVVKDSAALEWEHSPQSVCAINSCLFAPSLAGSN